ncbi:GFA family protein [Psychromarinibacter sp. C21-152]|uniref:GFA family protein n=1 Tax=Psychromarinibacter sediminicola TaxID=3033385 RepID=A0AAE3NT40_9RHOB|nr:GFA family protein [Psychromarinibacter sediminicola]MDF0601154.1 GFA family protein [Psychromarinibacter sediminicola]
MTQRDGGCLCGAVRFTARNVPETAGICHCETCRRWTGTALVGVGLKDTDVTWKGAAHIRRRQTSSWAERAWCAECGSNLFFRFTGDGAYAGEIELPIGIFDDPNGFRITNEIYIDHKPDSYAYAGEDRQVLTRAQCVEKMPLLDGE